jgi:hypothetical protein
MIRTFAKDRIRTLLTEQDAHAAAADDDDPHGWLPQRAPVGARRASAVAVLPAQIAALRVPVVAEVARHDGDVDALVPAERPGDAAARAVVEQSLR